MLSYSSSCSLERTRGMMELVLLQVTAQVSTFSTEGALNLVGFCRSKVHSLLCHRERWCEAGEEAVVVLKGTYTFFKLSVSTWQHLVLDEMVELFCFALSQIILRVLNHERNSQSFHVICPWQVLIERRSSFNVQKVVHFVQLNVVLRGELVDNALSITRLQKITGGKMTDMFDHWQISELPVT